MSLTLRMSFPSQACSGICNRLHPYREATLKKRLIVRGELERMGFAVNREVEEPLPQVPEYLCRKCDYVGSSPGMCPRHKIELLEFSEFADYRRSQPFMAPVVKYLLLALVAAGAAFGIYEVVREALNAEV